MASTASAEYEDYTTVSNTYDTSRAPIALDSLCKALELASKGVGLPTSSLKLLDVGCGTGNYINAVKDKVGSCTGLEFNEGMLATAKAKLQGNEKINLFQGSIADMKRFESESFDVVIMTQVLHHLSMDVQEKAFVNIQKVLKPGGVFWLSSSLPEQFVSGFWFSALIPQAAATLASRVAGVPIFKQHLLKAELKLVTIEIPTDTLIMPREKYLDVEGPFSEQYRKSDSLWSLASKEELEAGLVWWREQIELGLAEKFMKESEEKRAKVGQTVAVTCTKELKSE